MTREDAFSIAFANYGDLYRGLYRYRLRIPHMHARRSARVKSAAVRGEIGIGYWFSVTARGGDLDLEVERDL